MRWFSLFLQCVVFAPHTNLKNQSRGSQNTVVRLTTVLWIVKKKTLNFSTLWNKIIFCNRWTLISQNFWCILRKSRWVTHFNEKDEFRGPVSLFITYSVTQLVTRWVGGLLEVMYLPVTKGTLVLVKRDTVSVSNKSFFFSLLKMCEE